MERLHVVMVRSAICLLCWCLGRAVLAGDSAKIFRTIPTVTNSLVNLGKIDVALYINPRDLKPGLMRKKLMTSSESTLEPCPCKATNKMKGISPSEMLRNMFHNRDLLALRDSPALSALCCESHEHREGALLQMPSPATSLLSAHTSDTLPLPLPLLLDSLLPNRPSIPSSPYKQKTIEIFLFPKKIQSSHDFFNKVNKKEVINKDYIKIVGDRELRGEFPTLPPPPPAPPALHVLSSSVKKDLALLPQAAGANIDAASTATTYVHTNTV